MEFTKRVAIITGGGSGIGRAVAAAMARRDVAAVALVDVNDAIDDVAATLNTEAGRAFAVPFCGDTTASASPWITSSGGQQAFIVTGVAMRGLAGR